MAAAEGCANRSDPGRFSKMKHGCAGAQIATAAAFAGRRPDRAQNVSILKAEFSGASAPAHIFRVLWDFSWFILPLPLSHMAKIEVNQVAEILKKHKLEPSVLREIVEEMNEITAPAADEDIKPPAPKKQFVVLLSDMDGKLPKKDLTGWVVQIPENASPFSTTDRIFKGAYDFNASKKGRMLPVKSVGEALESASAKYFKESELWVKTKMPVAVVVTDNVLPKDEFKVEKVDKRRKLDE